ncbi:T9SS type A sorting domain-containing protein [Vicingaceae bacterium]|nr:T9SS type A sorting domain-containing protein [Vicingaceae bacterium]
MPSFQRYVLVSLLLLSTLISEAQQKDTVRVMTYNLMYYRAFTSFCTSNNNSPTLKDNAMEDIFDYTLPDIFVVQEMGGGSPVNAFRILQNSINQNGRTNYTLANSNGLTQTIVNMLYFNTDKFVLESQTFYDKELNNNNIVRIIDEYVLYYNDSNLAIHQDTTRIHVLVAHLKAGSSSTNEQERARATESLMASLDSANATGNYIFAGDFNLYNSSEPAYQDLVNYIDPTLRFYDPINVSGNWHNSGVYAAFHTQSTRTTGGCFAGGGMDDRFDFILTSDEIINNTDKMRYIPNTYQAVGQDGNRFNATIISPTNNAVPTLVSQALYNLSDHLPVIMDVEVTLPSITSNQELVGLEKLKFENPNSGNLLIDFSNQKQKIKRVQILDLTGKILFEKHLNSERYVQFDISELNPGAYLIRATSASYQQIVEKLIKI